MSDQSAPGKVCINCHRDCADRPRVKDRAGRYICRECLTQMKATGQTLPPPKPARAAVAAAAAPGDRDIMMSLVDEAVSRQPESCPQCGVPAQTNAVLCVHCGYNRETGRSVRTRVERVKAEKLPRERRSRSFGIEISGTFTFFALCGVLGLMLFGGMMEPAFGLVYILFWGGLGLFGFIYLIVSAFADDEVVYGILAICSLFLPILGFATLYYVFLVSERGNLKAVYGAHLLGIIGLFPLIGAMSALAEGAA